MTLNKKGLLAGFYASVIGLIFASLVGGLGAWGAVALAAKTEIGGVLVLLVIGSASGYLYSAFRFDKLFGKETIVRGAAYGVLLWILSLILAAIFPVLGQVTFSDPIRANLFVQLLSHIVWGASLGLFFENL